MQMDDGSLRRIDAKTFDELMGTKKEHARVVQVGDTFMIRGCRFEVSDIKPDGIFAKGIPPGPEKDIGRNDLCPCGSKMKYKRCCMKQPVVFHKR